MLCFTAARDAFKSFDKKSEDKIRVGDIEAAMKRLGHNIKPDWLEKIEHMIDAEGLLAYYRALKDLTPWSVLTQVQSVQCTAGPCSDGPLFGSSNIYW